MMRTLRDLISSCHAEVAAEKCAGPGHDCESCEFITDAAADCITDVIDAVSSDDVRDSIRQEAI